MTDLRPKLKAVGKRALLSLCSVVFLLLVVEIALRVMNAADKAFYGDLQARLERSRDRSLGSAGGDVNMSGLVQASRFPDIVYEIKPGITGTFRGKGVAINSQGLRGCEHSLAKPAGTYRIVGLGDSVMFGWGVGQSAPYLTLLEQRLNALPGPHPVFETLNFAVPGYNTAMEAAVFEHKALAYDPDLVIIQFVNNDYGVPLYMLRPKRSLSLKESFLWDLIRTRLGWLSHEGLVGCHLEDVRGEERAEVLEPYRYMVGPSGYRQAMNRLAELAKAHGIPVIVLWGTRSSEQQRTVSDVAAKYGFRLVDVGPFTEAYVAREGIPNNKEARRKALQVSPGDHHPNARGHTIYADALMDALDKMGIIHLPASSAIVLPPSAAEPEQGAIDAP